jgi:lipid II:glycine glycyltransferase (peptidoglycan interpeptide bridge formation enzyme)
MSKSALEDFLESMQKIEDDWAAYEVNLNDYMTRLEQAREKVKASIVRVRDAARQAADACNELDNTTFLEDAE